LADLADAHPGFVEAGITLWAVSVDPPHVSALLKAEHFIPFDLLSDLDRHATRAYGILNPRERGGIPIPTIVAVGRDGRAFFVALDRMARQTRPDVLLEAVRSHGAGRAGAGGRRWIRPRLRDLRGILRRFRKGPE